jgi:hypothetical protein
MMAALFIVTAIVDLVFIAGLTCYLGVKAKKIFAKSGIKKPSILL